MAALPITGLYAGLLGLILLWLSFRVVMVVRARGEVSLGDDGNPEFTTLVRAQGNFVEYVPLAVLLLGIDELGGTSGMWLHVMGAALVLGRVMHPLGMRPTPGVSPLRFLGTLLTWLVLLAASVIAIGQSF